MTASGRPSGLPQPAVGLVASSEQRPGTLLNTLRFTGKSSTKNYLVHNGDAAGPEEPCELGWERAVELDPAPCPLRLHIPCLKTCEKTLFTKGWTTKSGDIYWEHLTRHVMLAQPNLPTAL